MILSRRVALNGIQLDQQDVSVVIRGVDPGTPKKTVNTVSLMGGAGQRVVSRHWDDIDVAVRYAIDIPKRQLQARQTVFDKVNAWAMAGGWLTVNYMSGKRLYVDDVNVPDAADLWNWTDEFTINFKARAVPFWQDATATTKSLSVSAECGGTFTVPGLVQTVCDVTVKNEDEETINALTVLAGQNSLSFSGLGLEPNEELVIGHGTDGLLSIRIRTDGTVYRSALDKRTGGSADDLYVNPGEITVLIEGGVVSAELSCYGRHV